VRHIHAAGRNQHRAADGNATGNGQTVDGKGHSPSPNLSAISASRASIASCSRSPSVSKLDFRAADAGGQHHHAHDAFGVDAALARLIQTSHGKTPASLVSLAEARACRPSLLLMVVVVLIMFRRVWFCGAVMATCITPWVPPPWRGHQASSGSCR
jgi:hypothetical protein